MKNGFLWCQLPRHVCLFVVFEPNGGEVGGVETHPATVHDPPSQVLPQMAF